MTGNSGWCRLANDLVCFGMRGFFIWRVFYLLVGLNLFILPRIMYKKQLLTCFLFVAGSLFADEIRIQDGGMFKGTIRSISESHIEIETAFAGTLKVDRTQVSGFSADHPVFVRLEDGTVRSGTISNPESGAIEVVEAGNAVRVPLASVRQGWLKPENDPEVIAAQRAEEEMRRRWKYQTAANFSGRSGNSDERRVGVGLSATLFCKQDELRLNASYDSRESNGRKSSDQRKLGARYTSYFNDPWGWYVRQEFEEDQFKNIQLRSMSAIGFSYRRMDKNKKKLALSAGVNYRHETYADQTPESSNIGLDLGLEHFFGSNRRFEFHNQLTVVPSVEDMTNYLISQDSYVDVPLTASRRWKIRLGLENDYNSQPTGGRAALDSRYYSSFVADWD